MNKKKLRLTSYLKKYSLFCILSPLLMAGEVIVDLYQPKLMSSIVNSSISGEEGCMQNIIVTGIIMLIMVAVGGFCGTFSAYTAGVAAEGFGNDIRRDTYKKVMSLSLEQTDKFTTGSLVTRLTNDITALKDMVQMCLRMVIRSPMFLIGGLIMCFTLDVKFTYVLIAVLPVMLISIVLIIKKANPLYILVQKKLDKVNSVVQENVSGARVVKAYTREKYEMDRFDSANIDYREINMKVLKLTAFIMPIMSILMNVAVVAIIYIGGLEAKAQAINVGDIMAGAQYVSRVLMSIMMVSMIFQQIARATACANRVKEVLESDPVVSTGTCTESNEKGTVRFENVSFAYPASSGERVLDGISFNVKSGEMVAIIGSTGCGKSSIVNLIPRFYDSTDGNVYVDGINVRDWSLDTLREKISFVLQKSELFSGTVKENIIMGKPDATDEEIISASETAQADEFVSKMPNKYYTKVSEKGASLSGGQKQRIAIARAVIRKPEIIILDDSTSALDLSTEAKLRKSLREQLAGTTVIMIAQRIASVMEADRIVVVDNGKIVAFDNHDNLMKSCESYRDIYDSQMSGKEVQNG